MSLSMFLKDIHGSGLKLANQQEQAATKKIVFKVEHQSFLKL